MSSEYPVIVIGAGPIGLATAAHLRERGQEVLVLESGTQAGAAMNQWAHIKLFSPWRFNIDAAAQRLLETPSDGYTAKWEAPRLTKLPTGGELVSEYLEPLAAHPELAPRIRYGHKVVKISRVLEDGRGVDKARTANRDDAPFMVRAETSEGLVDLFGRAVVDASGTWNQPSPIGRAGIEAIGEAEARDRGFILSGLPDPLGTDEQELAGKSLLVLGAGHSAANTIIAMGRLQKKYPDTTILWGLRGAANPIRLYGGGAADQLPARGQLGTSLRRLVDNGNVKLLENVAVVSVGAGERAKVSLADGRELTVDRIIAATGFRPELQMLSELRLDLDENVEAPRQLGPLIDPEFHSCGTVSAHGEKVLAHPEKNFYIVGMKSYGRAPTFLMATGYEQVRSIAAALAGDTQAADRVELDLPETGVCSTDLGGSCDAPAPSESSCGTTEASAGDSCCGSGPQPVTLGLSTGTLHGNMELVGGSSNE